MSMARSWDGLRYNIRCRCPRATDALQNTSRTACSGGTADYVKAFFSETTVHGLQFTVASGRHPVERWLWIAVTFMACAGAIFVILRSWERYVANPTVVAIEKGYRQWPTLFPAVTMCPLENLDTNGTELEVRRLWGNIDQGKILHYSGFLNTVRNASLLNLQKFEEFENDTKLVGIEDLGDLAAKMQIPLWCDISYMDEDIEFKLQSTLTELGLCYTWGSNMAHFFASRNEPPPPSPSNVLVTPCGYEDLPCGIRVYLKTNVKFYVHSTDDMPTIGRDKPQWESHGTERKVYVRHRQIVASQELRQLHPDQRGCLFRDEVQHHLPTTDTTKLPFYTYNLCKMACRSRMAKRFCSCIPFFYRTIDGGKVCDAKGMACLSRYSKQLSEDVNKPTSNCSCYQNCEQTDYIVDREESSSLESEYNISQQSVQFFVGIEQYSKTRLRRDIIYTFEDLLVSFGGTASLFLGCSILSGVELLYYFTLRLVCTRWAKHKEERKIDSPSDVQQRLNEQTPISAVQFESKWTYLHTYII